MQVKCDQCSGTIRVRDEYAGRKMKCPRCANVISIPTAGAVKSKGSSTATVADKKTKSCPKCGKTVLASAERCRFCRADLTAAEKDSEAAERPGKKKKHSKYKPCPQCKAVGAKPVKWTAWGSFYGPALLTHVRCPFCGFAYNGKTGRSNLIPAIFFVAIPLAGLLVLIYFIVHILRSRGHLNF